MAFYRGGGDIRPLKLQKVPLDRCRQMPPPVQNDTKCDIRPHYIWTRPHTFIARFALLTFGTTLHSVTGVKCHRCHLSRDLKAPHRQNGPVPLQMSVASAQSISLDVCDIFCVFKREKTNHTKNDLT
jgi:hypothetical protein